MRRYQCTVCTFIYDESEESILFDELPIDWKCPVCGAPKSAFVELGEDVVTVVHRTTADVMVEQLANWGIHRVYGIPGTSCLPLVDAIRRANDIDFITMRHEEAAAFAASAHAKLTQELGCCLSIAGPGATNLVTGLYDAKLDRAPVLALTGQVRLTYLGPGSFQEIDQEALFEPITVFRKTVASAEQTVLLTNLAAKHALTQRGVAQLSIPNDVQRAPGRVDPNAVAGFLAPQAIEPVIDDIEDAAARLTTAQHPVIIAGWGARGAARPLIDLAERITAPIATTYRAKGLVPETHPLAIGVLGDVGTYAARSLTDDADLLLVVGSSYSEKTNIPTHIPTIQIDLDPQMIAKTDPVETGLWGDAASVLTVLLDLTSERPKPSYRERIAAAKEEWEKTTAGESSQQGTPLRPPFIIRTLEQILPEDAVITVDVGESSWWFGRTFRMSGRQTLLMSGYLGSMGFSLRAAIASCLAQPDRPVICITGDGGFTQVMGEFLTVTALDLPLKTVVLNNRDLAMIRIEQMNENLPAFATELNSPDFSAYASIAGAKGIRVQEPDELGPALTQMIRDAGPVLVDIDTDPRRFI